MSQRRQAQGACATGAEGVVTIRHRLLLLLLLLLLPLFLNAAPPPIPSARTFRTLFNVRSPPSVLTPRREITSHEDTAREEEGERLEGETGGGVVGSEWGEIGEASWFFCAKRFFAVFSGRTACCSARMSEAFAPRAPSRGRFPATPPRVQQQQADVS
ncbi:unnamed protein product [Lampetra fluviatilis]